MTIKTIAFDGDDTLWHHEAYMRELTTRFHTILNEIGDYPQAQESLETAHIADLKLWGYGVKSLTLTMIETAIKITNGTITGTHLQKILDIGKETYLHPIQVLDHVRETLAALHKRYFLIVITKGDLLAQEMKLSRSGLLSFFDGIEIVSEKDPDTYKRIFKRYDIVPEEFVMVGNSVRSDILPVLSLGAKAVHIPYHTSWQFENPEVAETDKAKFTVLPSMETLPALVKTL